MNTPFATSFNEKCVALTTLLIFLVLILETPLLYAQKNTFTVEGQVFVDENQNGNFDSDEKGKQGVFLSNGIDIVRTNKSGSYTISVTRGQIVYPIIPTGYSSNEMKEWWFNTIDKISDRKDPVLENINFGLVPTTQTETTKVLAVGDVQVGNKNELDYAGRTVFQELMSRDDYDLSIFLGDLVNDEPMLMKPIKKMINGLDEPTWMVYGNHDRNFDRSQNKQGISYNNYFGPKNYAFYKNDILFIGLNSLIPKGKFGYKGRYRADDLEFVDNLLETVPLPEQIVFIQHIPLRWVRNNKKMISTLDKYLNDRILVLSGHTHTVFQEFYETNNISIHEVNVGATSGHWWTGQKNWQGNPLALMKDGTPRGYFEILFEDGSYDLKFKGVGLDQHKQMSIWFGESNGEVTQKIDSENRKIYVNVFAGSKKTKVKIRADKGNWITLKKVHEIDPFVANIKHLQESEKYPNNISKKSPYLDSKSKHLWKGQIPKDLKEGMYKLEIKVDNPFGADLKDSTWFWIE